MTQENNCNIITKLSVRAMLKLPSSECFAPTFPQGGRLGIWGRSVAKTPPHPGAHNYRLASQKGYYHNNTLSHAGRCPEFRSHNELCSEIQTATKLFLLAVSATGSARKRAPDGERLIFEAGVLLIITGTLI